MPPPPGQRERRYSSPGPAVERRRKVFTGLVCICAGTFILGLVPALRWLLWIHLFADLVLAGLIAVLISLRSMGMPAGGRHASGSSVRRDVLPGREVAEGRQAAYRPESAYGREAAYGRGGQTGMFEPAGHGYRLTGGQAGLAGGGRSVSDPPSIRVLRADDPPSARVSGRQERVSGGIGTSASVAIGSPAGSSSKPKMFLDEEEEGFLQAQGL